MKIFRTLAVASLFVFVAVLAVGYSPPSSNKTVSVDTFAVSSAIPYGYTIAPRGDSAAYALFTISEFGPEGRTAAVLSSAPFLNRESTVLQYLNASRLDRAGPSMKSYDVIAGADATAWANKRPVMTRA